MAAEEERIPLVEERAVVSKRRVETGRVRVNTRLETREELVREDLVYDEVEIERVPIGTIVDEAPQVREESDRLIIPVLEEELVLTKRLVLVEEIHLRRRRGVREFAQAVPLHRQRADVVRDEESGN